MSAPAAPYPYTDGYNPDLLERIPPWAKVVLDIGCGTGALGLAFKQRNPRARVFGIENNPGAAMIAARRLDGVIEGEIETLTLPQSFTGTVDCLIYGDVLEHLRDPWAVLRRHARLLAPAGVLLASIPNVEHWRFAARLLQGGFRYEASGLFDRTHLRWFSRETAQEALAAAGYVALECIGRVFDAEEGQRFIAAIAPALAALGVDREVYARRALALQHVWRGMQSPPAPLQIAATMLPPVGGVSHVRVIEPMRALAAAPGVEARLTQLRDLPPPRPGVPRILILHRPALLGAAGLATLRAVIAAGFLVVCEFDDHPDYIPILQHPEMHNFRAVHAVQTTTPRLALVLGDANPEVAVFPNAVRELPTPRNFADPASLTLFFGGINREADWPVLMPAVNAVAAQAGARLRFVVVHDRGFFEALATPHKEFHPMLDYPAYLARLAEAEISFMPLAETDFNRCKSDLKFIEAAARRVAALASTTVYGEVIEDQRTGVIFHDPESLARGLWRMIEEPEWTRALAEAARLRVARERMLADQILPRLAWYRDLWARRRALHAALIARVPEFADLAPPETQGGAG
jgi:SAM-dependent methyltransferase